MPANIIIADDTPDNLTVLRDILARDGHRVRPVLQGELAIRIARLDPPDLILLDIVMPGLSGYETCARLKADPLTADCPVLFISALDAVGDKVRGFQVGALDYITKPFQVDEVLARVRTHLALHQARQTLARQNRQLAEAARLREDVDRILRHDLRGPLGNMIAFSELVEQATLSSQPQVAQHARVISDTAYALLSMVHGSFDLLKMERGDYEAQTEDFDLPDLLRSVMREMAPMAAERQLALQLHASEPLAPVRGERLLCRSLFHNLLRNAIEASPEQGVISLRLQADAAGQRCVVAVRNAGEVPVGIRDRFFEKYVTGGKPGGSGLGTYSARLMAQAQGGSIRLDCHEPGHTQVIVRLPLASPDGHIQPAGRPCTRLLIADDDPLIHRYLAQVLPDTLALTCVSDGLQAMEQLATADFDHALIDLHMPGADGVAVARAHASGTLRNQAEPERCTLIALSGTSDAAMHRRCLSEGFDHVLTKPPSLPVLLGLLGLDAARTLSTLRLDRGMQALTEQFLASRPAELDRLGQAIRENQAARVASLAHKLQGSFAMYGFAMASQIAASIEACAASDMGHAATLLTDLHHHLASLHIDYT